MRGMKHSTATQSSCLWDTTMHGMLASSVATDKTKEAHACMDVWMCGQAGGGGYVVRCALGSWRSQCCT